MYPEETKHKVVEYVRSGHTYKEAMDAFGVGKMSVWRWLHGRREGADAPRARRARFLWRC